MAKAGREKQSEKVIAFNMAPMIDVVFLLLIFFALVTRFASAEKVQMELPDPEKSQAVDMQVKDRVVINCRPADPDDPEGRVLYSAGPLAPESLDVISRRLRAAKASVPNLKVVIRADKRVPFAAVRAAMQVVVENRIDTMHLVAHVGGQER